MEVVENAEAIAREIHGKMEMDQSVRQGDSSGESGIFSNGVNTTSNTSWQIFEDEIVDPVVFDPPVLQSSGLKPRKIDFSLSAIEGTLASSVEGRSDSYQNDS